MIVNIIECDIDFVPVRGLFNLTSEKQLLKDNLEAMKFPSPSEDYLI